MAGRSIEDMEREVQKLQQTIAAEKLRQSRSSHGSVPSSQQCHDAMTSRRRSAGVAMSSSARHSIGMSRSLTAQPTPSLSADPSPLLSIYETQQFANIPQEMLDRYGQPEPANAYMLQRAAPALDGVGMAPGDFINGMSFTEEDFCTTLNNPPSLVSDSGESNGTPMSRSSSAGYMHTQGLSLDATQQSPCLDTYPNPEPFMFTSESQMAATGKSQLDTEQELFGLGSGLSVPMSRTGSNLSSTSMRSSASHQEKRAREARERQIQNAQRNLIQPKPLSEADKPDSSSSANGSPAKKEKMALPSKKGSYVRPPKERVHCTKCDAIPRGFRGQHELQRHMMSKHESLVKRWTCRDPRKAGVTTAITPVVPLSKCKACLAGKKYGAYYNAAAHLRRAHFREKSPRKGGKRGEPKAARPSKTIEMNDLKQWMESGYYPAADERADADNPVDNDMEDEGSFQWDDLSMPIPRQAFASIPEQSLPSPPISDGSSPATYVNHVDTLSYMDMNEPAPPMDMNEPPPFDMAEAPQSYSTSPPWALHMGIST